MIVFVGDLHGNYAAINRLNDFLTEDDTVIQVGDFGFYDRELLHWMKPKFKTFAIDGNHEDFRIIGHQKKVTEIRDNLFYVPRGTTMEIEGKRFGFLGGGASIDKAYRKEGVSWFPEEVITETDVKQLLQNVGNTHLDYLVTHTPGARFISAWFGKLDKKEWGLPDDWVDYSANIIDYVLDTIHCREHICGHMHRNVFDGKTRCVDINQYHYV